MGNDEDEGDDHEDEAQSTRKHVITEGEKVSQKSSTLKSNSL